MKRFFGSLIYLLMSIPQAVLHIVFMIVCAIDIVLSLVFPKFMKGALMALGHFRKHEIHQADRLLGTSFVESGYVKEDRSWVLMIYSIFKLIIAAISVIAFSGIFFCVLLIALPFKYYLFQTGLYFYQIPTISELAIMLITGTLSIMVCIFILWCLIKLDILMVEFLGQTGKTVDKSKVKVDFNGNKGIRTRREGTGAKKTGSGKKKKRTRRTGKKTQGRRKASRE